MFWQVRPPTEGSPRECHSSVKQSLCEWREKEVVDAGSSGRQPADGHTPGVASEQRNVLLDPVEGLHLVVEAVVARRYRVLCGEEPECIEPVLDSDQSNLFLQEVLGGQMFAATKHKGSTMYVENDREEGGRIESLGVNIQVEAVFGTNNLNVNNVEQNWVRFPSTNLGGVRVWRLKTKLLIIQGIPNALPGFHRARCSKPHLSNWRGSKWHSSE